ncbi:CAP domain-containing protein [Micromonospora psammae]|uniref:CAP domain-containing protein n=1 Tax=Micromonospora sp. CPCC 205556 TaxID=3122398 RepID=UPI002FEEF355
MYGWNDPIDPEGTPRRPQQPSDEPPAWLNDRTEPRSAYLFGDEPGQPGDRTAAPDHRYAPATDDRWADTPTGGFAAVSRPYAEPDRTAPVPPVDLTAPRAAVAGPATDEAQGRHRQRRRFPRSLVIGGAAAAATLVVSLGVGALVLPGGNDERTEPASFDDTVAAAPVVPATTAAPGEASAAPTASPSASPTTAKPSPSPSRTVRPTPAPKRTTAASRQRADRTPTGAGTTSAPSGGTQVGSQAKEVVRLVNAERAKAGCGAVTIDDKLMTAAQRHSQDQADHKDMSHDGSDGSDAAERLDRVGYSWRTYGENVAWNQQTPAEVMDAWMTSAGHRENILNCAFTEIGVGIASSNGPYWTQVFAAPR